MSYNMEQVLAEMKQHIAPDQIDRMIFPPPVFVEMQGEFINYDRDQSRLVTRFPVQEKHLNPLGYLQGGVLAALLDNTIGPLSFMVAPPNVTTQFNISYLRPTTRDESPITVTAQVIDRTRGQLFIQGRAENQAGKTLAIAHASHQIIKQR